MRIFVYGTLKRGHSNHQYLRGQKFLGMAMTHPRYRLHDLGGYPGMVLNEREGISIHGEVWEVDEGCLTNLDVLEDTAHGEYVREVVPLMPPFDQDRIEGYRYLQDVSEARDLGACW
ncbi:MAG: gamma-glutamylcyclotransferase family protein [Verrucomicrobiota bacterium]